METDLIVEQCNSDSEETEEETEEETNEHGSLTGRMRRTLHIDKTSRTGCPSLPLTDAAVEWFQEMAPQPLGKLDMYLASDIASETGATPTAVLTAMMYAGRLKRKKSEFLNQVSSTDVFLISMLVASKYLYDDGVDEEVYCEDYAQVGQVSVEEINELERKFLSAIEWSLYMDKEQFNQYLTSIERRVAWKSGTDRGFFTYTDLSLLLSSDQWSKVWREILRDLSTVVLSLSVSYWAAILSALLPVISLRASANVDPALVGLPSSTPVYTIGTDGIASGTKGIIDVATVPASISNELLSLGKRLMAGDEEWLITNDDSKDVANGSQEETKSGLVTQSFSDGFLNHSRFTNDGILFVTIVIDRLVDIVYGMSDFVKGFEAAFRNTVPLSESITGCGHGRVRTCPRGRVNRDTKETVTYSNNNVNSGRIKSNSCPNCADNAKPTIANMRNKKASFGDHYTDYIMNGYESRPSSAHQFRSGIYKDKRVDFESCQLDNRHFLYKNNGFFTSVTAGLITI